MIHIIEIDVETDLEIDLESPSGIRINLVASDNEMNLNELKFERDLPELRGESVNGSWKLIIADRYAEDSGVLKRWSLTGMISAEVSSEPQTYTTSPSLLIPDNDPEGISAPLEVEAEGSGVLRVGRERIRA